MTDKVLKMSQKDSESCKKRLVLSEAMKLMGSSLFGVAGTIALYGVFFSSSFFTTAAISSSFFTTAATTIAGIAGIPFLGGFALRQFTYNKFGKKYSHKTIKALEKNMELQRKKSGLDIDMAEAKEEYGVDLSEKSIQKQVSDKNRLSDKEKHISVFSKHLRKTRETAVAKAKKSGKPLSAKEVITLRTAEEKSRLKAHKEWLSRYKKER